MNQHRGFFCFFYSSSLSSIVLISLLQSHIDGCHQHHSDKINTRDYLKIICQIRDTFSFKIIYENECECAWSSVSCNIICRHLVLISLAMLSKMFNQQLGVAWFSQFSWNKNICFTTILKYQRIFPPCLFTQLFFCLLKRELFHIGD